MTRRSSGLLLFLPLLIWSPFLHSAAKTKSGSERCDSSLRNDPEGLREYLALATQKLKLELGDESALESLGNIELESSLNGAFIIRKQNDLILAKQLHLGKSEFREQKIEGSQIEWQRTVGPFYVILSSQLRNPKHPRSRKRTYHLNIFNSDLSRSIVYNSYSKPVSPEGGEDFGQTWACFLGTTMIQIGRYPIEDKKSFQDKSVYFVDGHYMLHDYNLGKEVIDIDRSPTIAHDLDLPLVEVTYKSFGMDRANTKALILTDMTAMAERENETTTTFFPTPVVTWQPATQTLSYLEVERRGTDSRHLFFVSDKRSQERGTQITALTREARKMTTRATMELFNAKVDSRTKLSLISQKNNSVSVVEAQGVLDSQGKRRKGLLYLPGRKNFIFSPGSDSEAFPLLPDLPSISFDSHPISETSSEQGDFLYISSTPTESNSKESEDFSLLLLLQSLGRENSVRKMESLRFSSLPGKIKSIERGVKDKNGKQSLVDRLGCLHIENTRGPLSLCFDQRNGSSMLLPNLSRIEILKQGTNEFVVFLGQFKGTRGQNNSYVAVYNENSGAFVSLDHRIEADEDSEEAFIDPITQSHIQAFTQASGNVYVEGQLAIQYPSHFEDTVALPALLSSQANIDTLEVSIRPDGVIKISSPSEDWGDYKGVEYHLDPKHVRFWTLSASSTSHLQQNKGNGIPTRAYYGTYLDKRLDKDGRYSVIVARAVSESLGDLPLAQRSEKNSQQKKVTDSESHMTLITQLANGKVKTRSIDAPGVIEGIEMNKKTGVLYATGYIPALSGRIPLEVYWDGAKEEANLIIINKNIASDGQENILYEDAQIRVFGSRESFAEDPKVYIMNKSEGKEGTIPREAELSFSYGSVEETNLLDELFQMFFGSVSEKKKEKQIENKHPIRKVERIGGTSDDVLVIHTEGSSDASPLTFFYSLKQEKVLLAIPNYQSYHDEGDYRFLIGHANQTHPSLVAVVNPKTYRLVTFFNFGQTKVDIESSDAIRRDKNNKNLIRFRTTYGSDRLFDLRNQHFLGMLSPKAAEIAGTLEGKVGRVLNDRLFQEPEAPVFSRDSQFKEMEKLFPFNKSDLFKRSMGVAILGNSGAGATSFVRNYLARYIDGGVDVGSAQKWVMLKVSQEDIGAGTSFRGQLGEKFQALETAGEDLRKIGYRLVVFMDNVDQMVEGDWKDDEGSLFRSIPNHLSAGAYDIIATASPSGWQLLESSQPQFTSKFGGTLHLEALSPENTFSALVQFLDLHYQDRGGAALFSREALISIFEKLNRYSSGRVLPVSAIDLATRVVEENAPKKAGAKIPNLDKHLVEAMGQQLGIPALFLNRQSSIEELNRIEARIKKTRVLEQEAPVSAIFRDYRAFTMGKNNPRWPISAQLFLGSTGVGKTELVEAEVDLIFGGQSDRLLKISGEDYSIMTAEYNPGKLKKLIVNQVKKFPMSLVLFDEIEKMSIECRKILLSVLDGRISDDKGRTVYTNNLIVRATSNAGLQELESAARSKNLGFKPGEKKLLFHEALNLEEKRETLLKALKNYFPPEVINRFQGIQVFDSLGESVALSITKNYLETAAAPRFLNDDRIHLEFDEDSLRALAYRHVNIEFGARRLVMAIEQNFVSGWLTQKLIDGDLAPGESYIIGCENPEDVEEDPEFTITRIGN